MKLLIQNLKKREREIIIGSYRHLHRQNIDGARWLEIENDTNDGKACLYLDEDETYRLMYELAEILPQEIWDSLRGEKE